MGKLATVQRFFVQHAPTILVLGGLGAIGTGTGIAIWKTVKVYSELMATRQERERINNEIVALDEANEVVEKATGFTLNVEDAKDKMTEVITVVQLEEALKVNQKQFRHYAIKQFAAPTIIFLGGMFCVVIGHRMMLARYLALGAAYAALTAEFGAYRAQVVEQYGEDVDAALAMNSAKAVQEAIKNGTLCANPEVIFSREVGRECFWYDETNIGKTLCFLRDLESDCNLYLRAHGDLSLNQVLRRLGLKGNNAGAMALWLWEDEVEGRQDVVQLGIDGYLAEMRENPQQMRRETLVLRFNPRPNAVGPDPYAPVGKGNRNV